MFQNFCAFVDNNIQPTWRSEDSHGPKYFFNCKFTRIDPPKKGEINFDEKSKSSVCSEFNRAQVECGRGTISGNTCRVWLKKFYGTSISLCPHMTDYCDTCKHLKEEIKRCTATIRQISDSGNVVITRMKTLEEERAKLERELKEHKEDASNARKFFHSMTSKCSEDWKAIVQLQSKDSHTLTDSERAKLDKLKRNFTLVLSCDYQMSKLIPQWGRTEQPGQTYYLMKVSHDIFGIVDHRGNTKSAYIFSEEIGPKNTDHTISFLVNHIQKVHQDYPWIKRLCIFMDNAGSTNKNRFMFAWTMDAIHSGLMDSIHIGFMVAGHTKFDPDRMFSAIANGYNHSDIFNIRELCSLCQLYSTAEVSDGSIVYPWREYLKQKYTELSGIRRYHGYLTTSDHRGKIVIKVREKCFRGEFQNAPMKRLGTNPRLGQPYSNSRKAIGADKKAHIKLMCRQYIDPARWPDYAK